MPVCAQCGLEAPPDARFCAACGASLATEPAREERKVVTVLFADLVGSTARAEALDPEDVRAILAPYYAHLRLELERFGGTVEKFIGDAVMAVFGAPVAHEDDAERAVRAGLAIRDWVLEEQELQVRIAVHTGEALVSLGARPLEGEGIVAGDVVNTAARLQSGAPVNGILVGEQTYRATERAIEYRDVAQVTAKGKSEPIEAWEAVQARSRFGVDVAQAHSARLVGRGHELAVLREVVERVVHDRTAQLLTIMGAPGIGKSRLVFETMQLVAERRELILWRQGRSLPYGQGVTFWAFAEIVKAHAGVLDGDSSTETEAKLRQAAETVAGEEAEWVLRHLSPLAGVGEEGVSASNQVERFAAWRRFVEGIAEQSPAVLVFEDLHWADDGLLDFIDHLVEWVSGLPLLVIGTARPEFLERRPAWGGGKLNATTLALSPLSDEETGRLVLALIDRPLLPDEDRAVVEGAGGNPLYAEQYARMLIEQDVVADVPLPESVQGIIAGRLDALPPEQKRLLQDASVFGKVFWSAALAGLGSLDERELAHALHALERKDLVQRARRSSVTGSEEYSFRHVLVRDVAYGQLPRLTRVEKHRAAALWLESLGRAEEYAEMLAHHYLTALELARAAGTESDELVDQARGALAAAADRAWTLDAFGQTVAFARQALELCPEDDDERPYLLLRIGRGRRYSDETGAQELEQARDGLFQLGDRASAAEAAVLLAALAFVVGDRSAVERHAADAETLIAEVPPSRPKALVLSELARFHMGGSAFRPAAQLAGQALELAETLGLDAVKASALNTRGVARVQLGERDGLRDLEDSLELSLRIESVYDVLRGYTNLAQAVDWLGDGRRSHELNLQNLRVTERLGASAMARWVRGNLAAGYFELGEWDEALRFADDFIAEVESGAPHAQENTCRSVRAEIRLSRDDVDGAITDLEVAVDVSRRRGGVEAADTLSVWARMLVEAGRLDEAAAAFEELLAFADSDPSILASFDVAYVVGRLGRAEEIAAALEEVTSPSGWFEPALAYLHGDFVAAADRYAARGSLVFEAHARLAAARALAADGSQAEADEQLARALTFFRSVGATRYVREGQALLAASG